METQEFCSWKKSKTGQWCVVVPGDAPPSPGTKVQVRRKDGSVSEEMLSDAVYGEAQPKRWLVAPVVKERTFSRPPEMRARRASCKICRGPLRNCSYCAATDEFCGECAYDEQ